MKKAITRRHFLNAAPIMTTAFHREKERTTIRDKREIMLRLVHNDTSLGKYSDRNFRRA